MGYGRTETEEEKKIAIAESCLFPFIENLLPSEDANTLDMFAYGSSALFSHAYGRDANWQNHRKTLLKETIKKHIVEEFLADNSKFNEQVKDIEFQFKNMDIADDKVAAKIIPTTLARMFGTDDPDLQGKAIFKMAMQEMLELAKGYKKSLEDEQQSTKKADEILEEIGNKLTNIKSDWGARKTLEPQGKIKRY